MKVVVIYESMFGNTRAIAEAIAAGLTTGSEAVVMPIGRNGSTYELFARDLPEAERTKENLRDRFAATNILPIPWVERSTSPMRCSGSPRTSHAT